MAAKDAEKHIQSVIDVTTNGGAGGGGGGDKGPPSQKRLHMLHYAATIAGSSATVANLMTRKGMRSGLARQVKDTTAVEM